MYKEIIILLNRLFGITTVPPENEKMHDYEYLPLIKITEEDLKQKEILSQFNDVIVRSDRSKHLLLRKINIKELGDFIIGYFPSLFKDDVKSVSRAYLLSDNKDSIFCGIDDFQNNCINNPYSNKELLELSQYATYFKIHLDGGENYRSIELLYFMGNKYGTSVRITNEDGKWCRWFHYDWTMELPIDIFQLSRIMKNLIAKSE